VYRISVINTANGVQNICY